MLQYIFRLKIRIKLEKLAYFQALMEGEEKERSKRRPRGITEYIEAQKALGSCSETFRRTAGRGFYFGLAVGVPFGLHSAYRWFFKSYFFTLKKKNLSKIDKILILRNYGNFCMCPKTCENALFKICWGTTTAFARRTFSCWSPSFRERFPSSHSPPSESWPALTTACTSNGRIND